MTNIGLNNVNYASFSKVLPFKSSKITPKNQVLPPENIIQVYGASNALPTTINSELIKEAQNKMDIGFNHNYVKQFFLKDKETNSKAIKEINKTKSDKELLLTLEKMRYYAMAEEFSAIMAKEGYGTLTGNSGGIMKAANKGAYENGAYSVGVTHSSSKQKLNLYLDKLYTEKTWHNKLDRHNEQAKGPFTIVFPGGDKSICELWDKINQNLLDYNKTGKPVKPVVLVGKDFWKPMQKWLIEQPQKMGYLKCIDKNMIKIVDSTKEFEQFFNQTK